MSTSAVPPSRPVNQQIIKLSLCDAYSPKVWVTQTHFWPLQDSQVAEEAYEAIRSGLSRTLSDVEALGGTVGRSSDDPRDLVVYIDNAHVDLSWEDHSASEDVPSYDELKKKGFPLTGLVVPFSDPVTLSPVHNGSRMLAAKVNKLNGGLALSFGFNHVLADASTVAEIERIWSLHTADVSAGIAERSHKTSKNDEQTRIRLSTARDCKKFEEPHFKVFPSNLSQLHLSQEAVSSEAALTMLHKAREQHWAVMGDIDMPKWCIWYFSPDSLVNIKEHASQGLEPGEWISTMDALVGLFWSRISYLRRDTRGDQERAELCFPVSIRARLDPAIEPGYIGNAVDIVAVDASRVELEDPSIKGWAAAARSVRKAVTSWNPETWESWLAMAKSLPADQAICPNPLMLLNQHNVAFNDYSRSQSHLLSWGHLGRPERTRYMKPAGSMKGCATAIVVHPRLADGGLEVATTCTDDVRLLLEKDEVFKRYARLNCAYN